MDLMEEFDKYLKTWSKKNHLPCPSIDKITKNWQLAWNDFLKDVMEPKWEEQKQEFLNMKLLTKEEQRKREEESKKKEEIEEEFTLDKETDWDKVKKLMES